MSKNSKDSKIKWLTQPEEHDYPAALSYLLLLYDEDTANKYVNKLKLAGISEFKSKDIFRASQLTLLGTNNSHVGRDVKKIEAGESLSPLLLLRDSIHGKLIIADGYHRLCAIYSFDEDSIIPCKIV